MTEDRHMRPEKLLQWNWTNYEPFFRELAGINLDSGNVMEWLEDWSRLEEWVEEQYNRTYLATQVNTADREAEKRFNSFLDRVQPQARQAAQILKLKLLASELQPAGFEIPLRNLRAEAELFRAENLPLLAEEQKHNTQYSQIIGSQMVEWQGQPLTVAQLQPVLQDPERALREQAWRLAAERQLADREAINDLWKKGLNLRQRIAVNAGKADYRAYAWQNLHRFDYSPADCRNFHRSIEQVVVPAAIRVYEKRRLRLGVKTLRPWDLNVEPPGRSALRPFTSVDELIQKTGAIFHQVDPHLGGYFDILVGEKLLDLENRKNKGPGGFCIDFPAARLPFIFMNAVGVHDDVQTLLHESGHAFHAFECASLRFKQLLFIPSEFAEVASMSMELLASPFLVRSEGGFYSKEEASRARIEHLESALLFWPYMAVVDAFQHWVYENPTSAGDPAQCDGVWEKLWERFMPGVDWEGFEDARATGWQRKLHIHTYPFYYVEYGLALLGAFQIWARALIDPAGALSNYRRGLALGGTVSLPKLYQAAGARLAFDSGILYETIALIEDQVEKLETAI